MTTQPAPATDNHITADMLTVQVSGAGRSRRETICNRMKHQALTPKLENVGTLEILNAPEPGKQTTALENPILRVSRIPNRMDVLLVRCGSRVPESSHVGILNRTQRPRGRALGWEVCHFERGLSFRAEPRNPLGNCVSLPRRSCAFPVIPAKAGIQRAAQRTARRAPDPLSLQGERARVRVRVLWGRGMPSTRPAARFPPSQGTTGKGRV